MVDSSHTNKMTLSLIRITTNRNSFFFFFKKSN